MQVVVDPFEDRARRHETRGLAAKHAPRRRHHECGGHPVAGDVSDDQADLAVGKCDEVIEVAADLGRGAIERRDLPAGQIGQRLREELLLMSCAIRTPG